MADDKSGAAVDGPVTMVDSPIHLQYTGTAGRSASVFLRGIAEGRIVGMHCAGSDEVYMPPRGSCPKLGQPTTEEVELSGKGTVTSFTIVHIPIPGNPIKPPFAVGEIRFDGCALSFIHLISGIDPADVRIGMRVEPHWRPREEWTYSFENIKYFQPLDEPDIDPEELLRAPPGTVGARS